MGITLSINQIINFDTALIICKDLGINIKNIEFNDSKTKESENNITEVIKNRIPVVTIMGHVDHGKTTLLNALKKKNSEVPKEQGGITQHINIYKIEANKKYITLIDTPGHEYFSSIRSCGAKITDLIILTISADDGIMHQTIESITHAKYFNVPIIVAVLS